MTSLTVFDVWTIAVAPFPFVDSAQTKPRPCLILSKHAFDDAHGHSLCAMITRPLATARPSDLPIDVLGLARLPAPSMIRWKLFTLTNDVLKWTIGTLDEADRAAASQALAEILPDQPGAAF